MEAGTTRYIILYRSNVTDKMMTMVMFGWIKDGTPLHHIGPYHIQRHPYQVL